MRHTHILIVILAVTSLALTPTPTPDPTEVTMPEGWTAITETREIGDRQVALNDKGDAATKIDGEWYPVDAKDCFYKEFFDPKNQTDPKIGELIQKINSW